MAADNVEVRPVSKAEIEAGVTVQAGHPITFVVDGLKGKPRPGSAPDDDGVFDPDQPEETPRDVPLAGTDPGPDNPPAKPPVKPVPETPQTPLAGQLDLQVVSVAGAPQAALEVELTLPDGSKRAGRTGTDGHFLLDALPPSGACALEAPDVTAPAAAAPASVAGRVRYRAGVPLAIGSKPVVELPPRVRRGTLSGMHFETNKTFLLPSAMTGIRQLTSLYASFGALNVLVTGHTDTVGDADYNRGLSVERAQSIAAFLVDDAGAWVANYQAHPHSAAWGTREDQLMLAHLPEGGAPFYTGAIDGGAGPQTQAAFKRFQSDKGLPQSGRADAATRRALIASYMALEGTTLPQGSPPPLTHGCGFAHLAEKTGPNVEREANRRVEVFLFEGAVTPPPQTPCPAEGCKEFDQWTSQSGLKIDLDQPPGSLAVTVTDGSAPLDGVNLHAAGPVPRDAVSSGGQVSFGDLVPGKYRLIGDLFGFDAADTEVEVASGAPTSATLALKERPPMEIETFSAAAITPDEAKQRDQAGA